MNATTMGLAFGVALGFAGWFGGFGAFVVVLVVGVAGLLAGRAAEGKLDVNELADRVRRQP